MKRFWFLTLVAIGADVAFAQRADTTRNPLGNSPAAIAAGQRVYDQTCQPCHGASGQGDRGPALDTGTFTHGREDGDLFHTIREGVPASQMPPFRGLTDEQVWQLVSYIRSLAGPVAPPAARDAASSGGDPAAGKRCFSASPRARAAMK